MNETLQLQVWQRLIADSATALATSVAAFAPKLAGALAILAVGWLVARVLQALTRRLLARLGLDRLVERGRLTEPLREAGVLSPPSVLVARALFWIVLITFLLPATETLGLQALTVTVDRLVAYLPNVVAAGLLLLLGLLLGRFARGVVSSGAAAANVATAGRLGGAAQTVVVAVVAILALEQLGVEIELLVNLLVALVLGVSVTMGVAFALGVRPLMTHILAGHFLRQSFPEGTSIQVGERRGVVERVGAVDTLLRGAEDSWSIPNGQLLEQTVTR